MKDDVGVKKLVEIIFDKAPEDTSEMTAENSYFPPCLFTNDFIQKLSQVMSVRKSIVYVKWWVDFDKFYTRDILSDHKTYLSYIIFTCLKDHKCQSNVFESFITVCSTVEFFSDQTLRRTGLNYCEWNVDIVMEVYNSILKKTFLRRNGFKRLVDYISKHKYLAWNLDLLHRAVLLDPLVEDMNEKLNQEIISERKTLESFKWDLEELQTSAVNMAKKVLSTTAVKIPTFSSDQALEATVSASSLCDQSRPHASTKSVIEKDLSPTSVKLPSFSINNDSEETMRAATKSMSRKVLTMTPAELPILSSDYDSKQMVSPSSLNIAGNTFEGKGTIEADFKFEPVAIPQGYSCPYAKTYFETKRTEDIEWYESLVQAVIKYNQSEAADFMSSDNSILKRTGQVLERLENVIKSLIDILDEYDKE